MKKAPFPQPETVVSWLSFGVLIGALLFASGTVRGWVGIAGFLLVAAVFAVGRTGMPRYASLSYAVMFAAMAAGFGLPLVWPERPRWSDALYRTALLLSFIGAARYVWTRRGDSGAA